MTRDRDHSPERPAPAPEPTAQPRGPRQRVVRHLRRILVTTAATGAVAGLAGACGSEVESSESGGSAGIGGTTHTTGGSGGIGMGGNVGTGGEGGDVVCDPMPDPLVCTGDPDTAYFQEFAYWTAAWQQNGSDLVVHVTITSYAFSPDKLEFSADPTAVGGTVQNVERQPTVLELDILPGGDASEVVLTVPLDCNDTSEQLLLSIDVAPAGAAGDPAAITPAD